MFPNGEVGVPIIGLPIVPPNVSSMWPCTDRTILLPLSTKPNGECAPPPMLPGPGEMASGLKKLSLDKFVAPSTCIVPIVLACLRNGTGIFIELAIVVYGDVGVAAAVAREAVLLPAVLFP